MLVPAIASIGMLTLEFLDNADMRRPARSTAAEYETDARSLGMRGNSHQQAAQQNEVSQACTAIIHDHSSLVSWVHVSMRQL
jgi:hypothetical protein